MGHGEEIDEPEATVQRGVERFSRRALRAARKDHHWSQAELAEAAGISPSTIAGWERGSAKPTISRLRDVAKALGVAVEDLLTEPRGSAATLRDLRARAELTLLEAAELADTSKTMLGRLEQGWGQLPPAVADGLATAYDLDVSEILSAFAASKRRATQRIRVEQERHNTR